MIESLKWVRSLTWPEVVALWKDKEAEVWADYIAQHGLKDWEDYRFGPHGTFTRYGFDRFELHDQVWKEYLMPDAHMVAPRLYTGPFRSWTKYNKDNPSASLPFIQAIQDPRLRQNPDIEWTKEFLLRGNPSFGIGLYEPYKGIISLFDGHHSFSALNVLIEEGYEPLPQLPLYLAEVPEKHRDFFYDLIQGKVEPIPMPEAL